jgi:hypothetical protein
VSGGVVPEREQVAAKTDRELWREGGGDGNGMSYYEPSIHLTEQGGIGINVGGTVYVKSLREWHALADREGVAAELPAVSAVAAATPRGVVPEREAFWNRVDKTGDCWEWTGSRNGDGYGTYSVGGKTHRAHRYAYEIVVGPIPEGKQLDHLCRNPPCVNPAHLEPVTSRENTLRGFGACGTNARKTHCKNGHEFTPENTRYRRRGDYIGRECVACQAESQTRRRIARQKAAAEKRPTCAACGLFVVPRGDGWKHTAGRYRRSCGAPPTVVLPKEATHV